MNIMEDKEISCKLEKAMDSTSINEEKGAYEETQVCKPLQFKPSTEETLNSQLGYNVKTELIDVESIENVSESSSNVKRESTDLLIHLCNNHVASCPTNIDVDRTDAVCYICYICLQKFTSCLEVKSHILQSHSKAFCALAQRQSEDSEPQLQLLLFCPKDCKYVTLNSDALSKHIDSCQKPGIQSGGLDFTEIQSSFLSHGYIKLQHHVVSGTFIEMMKKRKSSNGWEMKLASESCHRNIFDTFNPNSDENDSDFDVDVEECDSMSSSCDSDSEASGSDKDSDPVLPGPSTGRSRSRSSPSKVKPDNDVTWVDVEPPETDERNSFEHAFVARSGPVNIDDKIVEPIDFFSLLVPDKLLAVIVCHTNKYARDFLGEWEMIEWMENHPKSRSIHWPEGGITLSDLKKYIGLCFNMGMIPKKVLEQFWSTRRSIQTPYFSDVMPRDKFLLINRMLHVSDREAEIRRGEEGFDPWSKVRLVLDTLNNNFKKYYIPFENISIDESTVRMKNKIVDISYMKDKRHTRFRIKKFELCDSANSYVLHSALYVGKEFDLRCSEGQEHTVVIELLRESDLLNKGYHVFTDRLYTKLDLARDLYAEKTYLTGTVVSSSKGFPKALSSQLPVGGTAYKRSGSILAVAFREKKSHRKPVTLLSTKYPAVNETKTINGRDKTKPAMAFGYRAIMGGVDIKDKKLNHYASQRATHRYWVKIFRNLLDMALHNAYELYKLKIQPPYKNKQDFILTVIESLCDISLVAQPILPHPVTPQAYPVQPMNHRLYLLEGRKEMNCIVCSTPERRRRSRHWCPFCQVGIHEKCEANFNHLGNPFQRRGRKRKL